MDENNSFRTSDSTAFAHLIWSAHLLCYLSCQQSQTPLSPTTANSSDPDSDEEFASDVNTVFNQPDTGIKEKLLDCLAEILLHTRGWHHVTATGLWEGFNDLVVDVVRNAGFDTNETNPLSAKDSAYFIKIENFMSTQGHNYGREILYEALTGS